MMREPSLNGGSSSFAEPQVRVNGHAQSYTNGAILDGPSPLKVQPKSAVALNGTYDVPLRSQIGDLDLGQDSLGQPPAILRHSRPPPLQRAHSDFGPYGVTEAQENTVKKDLLHMRHGWQEQYSSVEYLSLLNSVCKSRRANFKQFCENFLAKIVFDEERLGALRHALALFKADFGSAFYMYYVDKRHITSSIAKQGPDESVTDWRMKDRLKTVSAALAICLNIGVDPPDVVKTNPTAKLESWVDPTATTGGTTKVMEQIGRRLQEQYETLSLRTRYKQYLDPSIEETKRFCISLRRNAKDERVLFHYNGHGVPLPTASGELWVFNKNYTQYIPVGIYDLQSWLAGPSLFVYDVSHAGNIVHNFSSSAEKHEKENAELKKRDPNAVVQNYNDCIQLAACGRTENLPTNPNLPADLFTCCLTTPIDIALRFFVLQNPLPSAFTIDDGKIPVPGRLQDRRSPLGELNWIFTAITDTIAWNILPRALFKKLFRQDLMVAALFRNFLLSERIMRANHCRPVSSPELPETHQHPLWQAWDYAIEQVLAQLPGLIEHEEGKRVYEYQHSDFFAQQLTAFEVYLSTGPAEDHAPDQLPIVLQVLLSQAHRLRALVLLSRFLDLGQWAVHLALSIGIFPYVVKLLQSAAQELKPVMVFIWARIMAVDYTVQSDLLKDSGINYFISILDPNFPLPVQNSSEHRAMCAFIVATFCKNYPQGQTVCLSPDLIDRCLTNMTDPQNPLLRQWSCLCLSMLWHDYSDAKWMGIRCAAHIRLCELTLDPVPEVRAAMLHALTNFLAIPDLTDQVAQIEEGIASSLLCMMNDGSTSVRKELLVFYSTFVKRYENKFTVTAYEQLVEEKNLLNKHTHGANGVDLHQSERLQSLSQQTVFGSVWKQMLIMSMDPQPEVAQHASTIVDYIHEVLVMSPMGNLASAIIEDITQLSLSRRAALRRVPSAEPVEVAPPSPGTPPPEMAKNQSYLSLGSLRRAALSMRTMTFGGQPEQQVPTPPTASPSKQSQQKPKDPPRPVNTPRGRLPPEWSRPPETSDPSKPTGAYQQATVPTSPGFDESRKEDSPSLPLVSTLLDWSTEVLRDSLPTHWDEWHQYDCHPYWHEHMLILHNDKYFREPQMKPNEPDEPGSAEYNQRMWRRSRNERIIADNQPLKDKAGSSQWMHVEHALNNQSQPMKLSLHQFEDHLAVADDRDNVCIWEFSTNRLLSRFSAGNPPGSRINNIRFINEDDAALLMLGSSDGVLKVFRNYDSGLTSGATANRVEIVTAFRALTELIPSTRNAGLVFDWQQGQGKALVAGDVKVIKVWNAATEVCCADIPARSSSCVTSLTSDQVAGHIFVAGFGDGAIRVFDQRLAPRQSMVKIWREHRQWVSNVHMQRGGVRELVSGARNGEVKLWDIRQDKAILDIDAVAGASGATLRSLSVHEHAPVLAVGTDRHEVRSFSMTGERLGVFEPLGGGGVLGRRGRMAPVVATAYHPHRMLLAVAGLGDGHVSLVGY